MGTNRLSVASLKHPIDNTTDYIIARLERGLLEHYLTKLMARTTRNTETSVFYSQRCFTTCLLRVSTAFSNRRPKTQDDNLHRFTYLFNMENEKAFEIILQAFNHSEYYQDGETACAGNIGVPIFTDDSILRALGNADSALAVSLMVAQALAQNSSSNRRRNLE